MNISIQKRLAIGFFVILIALAFTGWRGVVGMGFINEEINAINSHQFIPSLTVAEANTALLSWNRALLNHVIAETGQEMEKYERIIPNQKEILLQQLHLLSDVDHLSKKGKELIQKIDSDFKRADETGNRVIELSRVYSEQRARDLIHTDLRPLVDRMDTDIARFIRLQRKQLTDVTRGSDERCVKAFWQISSTLVLAILVSLVISLDLCRRISKGVNAMVRGAGLIESGDFKKAKLHVTSKDEFGYLAGVFNHMLDSLERSIADREKKEKALRKSEERYSKLVQNSPTGIYVEQNEKIQFVNSRFAEIYRYAEEELLGIETWRLVCPEDRAFAKETYAKRLSGEDVPTEYEVKGLTNDGEAIWLQRRNALIEYESKPAILGNVVDITQQKQAEEELKKKNEELESFVYMVSHDLKNPIISIQGFSALALKKCDKELGVKGRNYLEQIKSSAGRMNVLVSDLLTLATEGSATPSLANVASSEIVNAVVSGLQGRSNVNRTEINVVRGLPTICCDAGGIYKVFENLIVNALKYAGDSKDPWVEIRYEDTGEFHKFLVRDNGIGIDPKYHKIIFKMFRRVSEIEDEEGTGIGLAIVERIVNNHGGKVWVESEKGKGATFLFALPKHPYSSAKMAR
jgi:PAS domain S-box-containing protein